jgi:hypothetical protein
MPKKFIEGKKKKGENVGSACGKPEPVESGRSARPPAQLVLQ